MGTSYKKYSKSKNHLPQPVLMEMVLYLNANHHVQNKGIPSLGKQDKHLRMISCLMKKMKMMALMMKKKLQESILLQRIQKKNQIHLKMGNSTP